MMMVPSRCEGRWSLLDVVDPGSAIATTADNLREGARLHTVDVGEISEMLRMNDRAWKDLFTQGAVGSFLLSFGLLSRTFGRRPEDLLGQSLNGYDDHSHH